VLQWLRINIRLLLQLHLLLLLMLLLRCCSQQRSFFVASLDLSPALTRLLLLQLLLLRRCEGITRCRQLRAVPRRDLSPLHYQRVQTVEAEERQNERSDDEEVSGQTSSEHGEDVVDALIGRV